MAMTEVGLRPIGQPTKKPIGGKVAERIFAKLAKSKVGALKKHCGSLSSGSTSGISSGSDSAASSRGSSNENLEISHVKIDDDRLLERTDELPIIGRSQYVTRPGYGRRFANYITLISNHFELKAKNSVVYHYDVEIQQVFENSKTTGDATQRQGKQHMQNKLRERKLPRDVSTRIIEQLKLNESGIGQLFYKTPKKKILAVYDGSKNLYAPMPLNIIGTKPGVAKVFRVTLLNSEVKLEGVGDKYKTQFIGGVFDVTIQVPKGNACEINMGSLSSFYKLAKVQEINQEVVTALNVILRYGSSLSSISVGQNSLFPINGKRADLVGGLQIAIGHYQSVRPCAKGLALIVDRKASAFYPNMSVIDFISYYFRIDGNNFHDLFGKLSREGTRAQIGYVLAGLNFNTFHLKHKKIYRGCVGLTEKPLCEIHCDGQPLIEYFARKYDLKLKHYKLPCLHFVRQDGRGSKAHSYLPLELCYLSENQRVIGKLKPDQTAAMIEYTASSPKSRFNEIYLMQKNVKEAGEHFLKEFGIDLSLNPIRVPGKVLDTPNLKYGRKQIKPALGSGCWRIDNGNTTSFYQNVDTENWVIINTDTKYQDLEGFANTLYQKAKEMDMKLNRPRLVYMEYAGRDTILECFKRAKKEKYQFIVWIAEKDSDDLYGDIKYIGESLKHDFGILSQFIKTKTLSKMSAMLMCNILQKINAKLGGVNQVLDPQCVPEILKNDSTMVIGADVTHKAPGDRTEALSGCLRIEYSIAAVVATTDNTYFNYSTAVRVQPRERLEIITQFDEMLEEVFKVYYQKNKQLPANIVYYRDGVSEGQFDSVLQDEVQLMEKLFKERLPKCIKRLKTEPYEPKITVVIVQKRHHTRVRPQFDEDAKGRMQNVPAGTTCDTTITQFRDFDFFLASHDGIQGTTRPTHYYVIRDDIGFNPDDMYEMTFFLTHTYAKCTRSISIPSPVQYAHLAAFRARDYLIAAKVSPVSDNLRRASDELKDDAKKAQIDKYNDAIQVKPELRNKLYFC